MITKNILVFFMSDKKKDATSHPFFDDPAMVKNPEQKYGESTQTNETALKYLKSELRKKGEKLDAVFSFVTKKCKEENNAWDWLKKFYPDIKEVAFKQDASASESLSYLAKMMNEINLYVEEEKKEACGQSVEFKVHVDFTGGFRHASMLMVSLVRMLKFANMKIEKVLYSKMELDRNYKPSRNGNDSNNSKPPKVVNDSNGKNDLHSEDETYFLLEDATEIMNMYTLIGGAEEFVNYGSANLISKYFENQNISPKMQDILNAMNDFAEKLKICTNQEAMFQSLAKLRHGFETYEAANTTHEQFFNCLLPIIKEHYKEILDACTYKDGNNCNYRKDVFSLIYWAADKGYLQQALTYYTEWVPEFLVENKWIGAPNGFKTFCKKLDNNHNEWYNYIFTAYNQWNPALKITKLTNNALYQVLNSRQYQSDDVIVNHPLFGCICDSEANLQCKKKLESLYEDFKKIKKEEWVNNSQKIDKVKVINALKTFSDKKFVEIVVEAIKNKKEKNVKNTFEEFCNKQYFNSVKLFEKLLLMANENQNNGVRGLTKILGVPDDGAKGIDRGEMFESLLAINCITIPKTAKQNISKKQLIELAKRYGEYKNKYRNTIAHASASDDFKASVLREEMKDLVRDLRNKI
ncbi:MAG: TM1812 family CRISPR-associated protein [Phascolarctobacterium sp.]|nr:TM1812 family CRISPR-associated protein [Phascolarctobacterium sp.]